MSGNDIVKGKDRILYIEPNDLPAFMSATSSNGQALDNISWDPEKFGIFLDLQVVIPSRQYNPSQDYNFSTTDDTKSWNKYESIFSGVRLSKDDRYLTADWTNVGYQEIKNNRAGSKEMLGINSINIIFDSHMYPVVTMNFTDVRGAALMMPEEQKYVDLNGGQVQRDEEVTKSFFTHLFRFPYPRFLLSVKGPYGTCVTFVLSVQDFKSTFNSESGNFDVVIKFIGNMYGLYTDIPMNYLIVAPYFGSPEGEYRKSNYWETNENFVFAESDGEPGRICTLLEFYDAFMNNGGEEANLGENIVKTAENDANKRYLDSILTGHYGYFEETVRGYGNNSLFIEDLPSNKVLLFNIDENSKANFKPLEFSKAVSGYTEEFPVDKGGFNFSKNYGNISFVYNSEAKGTGSGTTLYSVNSLSEEVYTGATLICDGITEDESETIKHKYPNYKDYKYAFVYPKSFERDIKDYISKLSSENNGMAEKVAEEVKVHFKDVLGFSPTIENIMRMIFAHLDAFLYHFYNECILQIKTSRTLSTLGGYPKNLTDIESTSNTSAHVPPFTAFFKEIEGKCERMFPGENPKYPELAKMPEVNFVNGILSAVGTTAKRISEMGDDTEYDDTDKNSEGTPDINESANINFTPTMPYDMYYNGVNPYDYLVGSETPFDVVSYFIYRAVLVGRCYINDIDALTAAAKNDAENFKKSKNFSAFKNRDDFKDILNNISSNLTDAGSFAKFWYKDGNFHERFPYFINSDGHNQETFSIGWDEKDVPAAIKGVTSEREGGNIEDILPLKTTFSDNFVSKFIEKLSPQMKENKTVKSTLKNFSDFTREDSVFFEKADKTLWGRGKGVTPIVPIGYYKLFNETPTEPAKPYFYKKFFGGYDMLVFEKMKNYEDNLYEDVNMNKKMSYDKSINNFIESAGENLMWVPSVPCLYEGTTRNLMVCNNVDTEKEVRAFLFLDGLILGDKYYGSKKDRDKVYRSYLRLISEYFVSHKYMFFKLTRAEYYFMCGLCYMKKNGSVFSKVKKILGIRDMELSNFIEKYGADSRELKEISNVFEEWANNDFSSVFKNNEKASGKYKIVDEDGNNVEFSIKGVPDYILAHPTGDTISTSDEEVKHCVAMMEIRNNFAVGLIKNTVSTFFNNGENNEYYTTLKKSVITTFVNEIKKYLGETSNGESYETVGSSESVEGNFYESFDTDDMKNTVYYTLKNLYDRWLSMQTHDNFKLYEPNLERRYKKARITNGNREKGDLSEFTNFAYVDTFFNDISKKFIVNPKSVFSAISDQLDGTVSYNILEFIGRICYENKLLFRCLPVYSNVYNSSTFAEIFTPHSLYDGTEKNGRRIGNTYLIMYTYEPSHYLDIPQDNTEGVSYGNDSFDIADTLGEITQEALEVMRKKQEYGDDNYSICAFGVTPAKQNQSYFTKVSVGMESPRVTDFSIANKFQLAQMSKIGGTSNIAGTGQNMYSIYSNRAYDCNVEMLGCANIMPMMYFQLNNVPMFKGAYMITKVEHNIQNNHMTTKFTGTRMPKRYIPFTKDSFMVGAISAAVNEAAKWRITGTWTGSTINPKDYTDWNAKAKALGITPEMHDDAAPKMMYEKGLITTVSDLSGYTGTVKIHVALADSLRRIFARIAKETNFKVKAVSGWRSSDSVSKTYVSGGNLGNNTSLHCFGCAVDINGGNIGNPWFVHRITRNEPEPEKGAMRPSGNKDNEGMKKYGPPTGGYDPTICTWHYGHKVVQIFEEEGWGWGGSYGDVMHFSVKGGS